MTCRQEVLGAARTLTAASSDGTFTPAEVVNLLKQRGTSYPSTTIRTHVTAVMCISAPDNHAVKYPDLVRVRPGRYALVDRTEELTMAALTPDPTALLVSAESSGESSTQIAAEAVLVAELGRLLGIPLVPRRVHLSDGSFVDVDAYSDEPLVLAEVWAHQGPPKSAQRNKVLGDALKLQHVAADLNRPSRLILCFADQAAAAPFSGATWYAGAIRRFGVEIVVVDLPDSWRERIRDAQRLQYR